MLFMGTSTISMAISHSCVNHYQRVNPIKSHQTTIFLWFSQENSHPITRFDIANVLLRRHHPQMVWSRLADPQVQLPWTWLGGGWALLWMEEIRITSWQRLGTIKHSKCWDYNWDKPSTNWWFGFLPSTVGKQIFELGLNSDVPNSKSATT